MRKYDLVGVAPPPPPPLICKQPCDALCNKLVVFESFTTGDINVEPCEIACFRGGVARDRRITHSRMTFQDVNIPFSTDQKIERIVQTAPLNIVADVVAVPITLTPQGLATQKLYERGPE